MPQSKGGKCRRGGRGQHSFQMGLPRRDKNRFNLNDETAMMSPWIDDQRVSWGRGQMRLFRIRGSGRWPRFVQHLRPHNAVSRRMQTAWSTYVNSRSLYRPPYVRTRKTCNADRGVERSEDSFNDGYGPISSYSRYAKQLGPQSDYSRIVDGDALLTSQDIRVSEAERSKEAGPPETKRVWSSGYQPLSKEYKDAFRTMVLRHCDYPIENGEGNADIHKAESNVDQKAANHAEARIDHSYQLQNSTEKNNSILINFDVDDDDDNAPVCETLICETDENIYLNELSQVFGNTSIGASTGTENDYTNDTINVSQATRGEEENSYMVELSDVFGSMNFGGFTGATLRDHDNAFGNVGQLVFADSNTVDMMTVEDEDMEETECRSGGKLDQPALADPNTVDMTTVDNDVGSHEEVVKDGVNTEAIRSCSREQATNQASCLLDMAPLENAILMNNADAGQ